MKLKLLLTSTQKPYKKYKRLFDMSIELDKEVEFMKLPECEFTRTEINAVRETAERFKIRAILEFNKRK